ncbi:MAG TPA: hypothetical protein PK152_13410 [Anaerolineales bacterium]|nr:hypothetical protein [Anaerolineae bacterium]HRJ58628.1 hypothetical protein [Anaerolineales bacterium]HRK90128.1 hypothetical protein [Anaerolineales bacterium]
MKNNRGLGCLMTGALVLIGLCVVAVGFSWWRLSTREPRILVEISNPQETVIANINEPLPLVVSAEADEPIARLEVYADGALIAASNGDGQNVLLLSQTWTPLTAGRHVLVARAFLTPEQFADSQIKYVDSLDLSLLPVQVNIDDIPRADGITEVAVNDLAAAAGTTPEEIARLNPSLAPGGTVPAGTVISLPRSVPTPGGGGGVPIPAPTPGGPGIAPPTDADPNFEGETHSCSQIAMRWSDSPDETSYRIYRVAPGEMTMSLLATLPADTTTYNDTPITRIGTYRYFLAPVRAGSEGITSMLAVEITPDCSPAGSATTNLRLSLISLTAQERYEGVYCYVSVNGSRYERLPPGDGLLRATSGDLYYDLPLQLANRGQYTLSPTTAGLVILEGECWGRRGAESFRVGRFSGSHASPEWDGRDLTSELAFEPFSVASLNDVPPTAGGANFLRYRIGPATSAYDIGSLYNGVVQLPNIMLEPLRRDIPTINPPVNVRIANRSLGLCDTLPDGDPNIGTALCEEQIIRSLTWEWSPNASGPQATGFMIITSIEDSLSATPAGEGFVNNVNSGDARSAPVPDYSLRWRCGATVRFTVRAITGFGMSAPSQPFEVRLPACRPSSNLLITVDSLTISPSAANGQVLDRGDICILCDDRRFEMFGMIALADNNNSIGMAFPPNHGAGTIAFGLCPHNTVCHNEGTFTTNSGWWIEMDYPITNRPLSFSVSINDYDTEDSIDLFCTAFAVLPARSAQEWSRANETVVLQSDFGEATCRFQISVRGQ